jgi:tetratricopeptide (TPR) repeat protein
MGNIIILDNSEGELPDVLTSTGQGGFLSSGYLLEAPATAAIDDGETPQFVLTNAKYGVSFESDTHTDEVRPGSGYRTIAVVTDRRVLILVGGVGDDHDKEFSVPHSEIEQVDSSTRLRHGTLTITRTGGATLTLHCGTDGLDDVTTFLENVSQAWVHAETVLEAVRSSLVEASDHREAGDIEAARTATETAMSHLEEAKATVSGVPSTRAAQAMQQRVETVSARTIEVDSRARRSYAHQLLDQGEAHWRAQEYEDAYDIFEQAIGEYETLLSHPHEHVPEVSAIQSEREQLRDIREQLTEAPLKNAEEAVADAQAADDTEDATAYWAEALERYRIALRLDWGAETRRFAGDPDRIREHLGIVAENLTAARRSLASDATEAGDWYAAAGQYEAALEEFAVAHDAFEEALTTARDCYPDAVEHLQTELDAVEDRIERARAELDEESARETDHVSPEVNHSEDSPTSTDTADGHTAGESTQSVIEK